jgi:hypothetical protein
MHARKCVSDGSGAASVFPWHSKELKMPLDIFIKPCSLIYCTCECSRVNLLE